MAKTLTPLERYSAILHDMSSATATYQAAVVRRDAEGEKAARERCHAILDAQLDALGAVALEAIRRSE